MKLSVFISGVILIFSSILSADVGMEVIKNLRKEKERIKTGLSQMTIKYNSAKSKCLTIPSYCLYAAQYKRQQDALKNQDKMFSSIDTGFTVIAKSSEDEIYKKIAVWREDNMYYIRNNEGLQLEPRQGLSKYKWRVWRAVPGF